MNLPRLMLRLFLGRRLPITSGALTVVGLQHPVTIHRDRWGIPTIEASGDADAWYGLGFCHGQDRTSQLEIILRAIRGTLAELFGPLALEADRLSRRIGFRLAADQQLGVLKPDLGTVIEAYARGVTAGGTLGRKRRPHEFILLRSRPTPWTAGDVLGFLKLMSLALPSNWDVELARLLILGQDGPQALADLDPAYPSRHPVTTPPESRAGPTLDRLTRDVALLSGVFPFGAASNNWALAPARTSTGRPILANDPHLASHLPSTWYLAHIRTPEWAVAGASFVGSPVIAAGHNGFAAWGMTAALTDNTDLFLEDVGPDNRSVRQGDTFIPCPVRRECIEVRGGSPVTEEVLITPRGPVISPALEGEVGAVSLRAVWLDPLPVEGMLRIHRARSFEEFRRSFERWPALPLNVVYADQAGRIGWQLAGQVPRRRKGFGLLPAPGWDSETGWEKEPVPFEQMPFLADPVCGFVASANNQPTTAESEPFLGLDFLDGYRQARIVEVLASRSDWSVKDVQAFQTDELSIPWSEVRAAILSAPTQGALAAREGLQLLQDWDGKVSTDSPAAAVFELFLAEMARRVARARAPRSFRRALGHGFTPLVPFTLFGARRVGHLARLLREQPGGWLPRPWGEEIAGALAAAVAHLRTSQGQDARKWAWGRVRPLTLRHHLGRGKLLGRVFNLGPVPSGGDTNTVNQATVDLLAPTASPGFIASLRMVVDVGAWDRSRFVIAGGQSGNPLSPNYGDQLALWRRGEGLPIAWSVEEVQKSTCQSLVLSPVENRTAEE